MLPRGRPRPGARPEPGQGWGGRVLVQAVVATVVSRWAAALAAARSLPLLVVVLDEDPWSPEAAEALLARATPALARAGVPREAHVVPAAGPASRVAGLVRDLLASRTVSLLVLGDDGSPLVDRLVEDAPCDVLVLPGLQHLPPLVGSTP